MKATLLKENPHSGLKCFENCGSGDGCALFPEFLMIRIAVCLNAFAYFPTEYHPYSVDHKPSPTISPPSYHTPLPSHNSP